MTTYTFTGPTFVEWRPFQVAPPTRLSWATTYGQTVWKDSAGVWHTQYAPTSDQLAGATVVYAGGYTYTLTAAQRTDLIAGGFGAYITAAPDPVLNPAWPGPTYPAAPTFVPPTVSSPPPPPAQRAPGRVA